MLMQLTVFLAVALLLSLAPVYLGVRVLRIGNPALWAAILGIAAALALQDLALRFIETDTMAWSAAILGGGIAFSLMLDCPIWKAILVCVLLLVMQALVTHFLLDGVAPYEELSRLVEGTQKELWPQYQ
ncbi:hypothetical protein [Ferrimonas marina]|uniref:Uncharacterized protein n=1 Tax=Ferrimonas marina TaxID=299255 RepID=A0A1M5YQS8_9GAMM|nr:hypothetical protein [Ferrimonas marina]SHI14467.1 hypothetical protein SAMN02745129_4317 [Ferrimonas marina]